MLKYYWKAAGEKYATCYRESTGSGDAENAKPSTIHKEVMALSRMLSLLRYPGKLRASHPEIPTVVVRNTRRRFIEDEELPKLLGHLEPHYRALFSFLALSGWRRGEALALQWRMVDTKRGLVRIED